MVLYGFSRGANQKGGIHYGSYEEVSNMVGV